MHGGRAAVVARWLARIDAAPPAARLGALLAELARPDEAARRIDRHARQAGARTCSAASSSRTTSCAAASVVAGTGSAPLVPAWTDAEIRRLLVDVTRANAPAAVGLWRAAGAPLGDRAAAIVASGAPLATGELAVTGKDLMDALAMPPGPAIGRLLAALLNRTLDDPSLNTRPRLLEEAQRLEILIGRENP